MPRIRVRDVARVLNVIFTLPEASTFAIGALVDYGSRSQLKEPA